MSERSSDLGISIGSLPTIKIEGRDWEYHAQSDEALSRAESLTKIKDKFDNIDQKDLNAARMATKEVMEAMKDLLIAIFVDGDAMYELVYSKIHTEPDKWFIFIHRVLDAINQNRVKAIRSSIDEFKQQER